MSACGTILPRRHGGNGPTEFVPLVFLRFQAIIACDPPAKVTLGRLPETLRVALMAICWLLFQNRVTLLGGSLISVSPRDITNRTIHGSLISDQAFD